MRFGTFPSTFLQTTVGLAIATPPTNPAGVVYCLHGRGGDHRFAVDTIRFQDFLAVADVPVALVSVDGGHDSYWHPRRNGTNALRMLVDELVPRIDAELGTADRPRAVLGWSMGGYGALLVAERYPDRFATCVAASPALFRRPGDATAGAFDGALDFEAHDVFTETARLDRTSVRIDCGDDDPFAPAVRAFRARLAPHPVAGGFAPGFHDAPFWRSVAPAQAAFLGRHLA